MKSVVFSSVVAAGPSATSRSREIRSFLFSTLSSCSPVKKFQLCLSVFCKDKNFSAFSFQKFPVIARTSQIFQFSEPQIFRNHPNINFLTRFSTALFFLEIENFHHQTPTFKIFCYICKYFALLRVCRIASRANKVSNFTSHEK